MIKPLFDNILIEPEVETKTNSGIILPDTAKDKPEIGNVIAVGTGTEKIKIISKVGDKVIYKKWTSSDIKFEGKKYIIVSQENVLAVI